MEFNQGKAEKALHEAREAFLKQDYPLALESYEWFFDHALDDPKSGLAAVRLSYCLAGWAEMGKIYEPARTSLEQRRTQSIRDLERNRKSNKFHEFIAICEYTGATHLIVDQFLEYHRTDKNLAKIIFGYAKEKLVSDEQWEVCSIYIDDVEREYEIALLVYDNSHRMAQRDPSPDKEFQQVYKDRYLSEASGLIAVLTHNRRFDEAQRICERADQDMRERGLTGFLSVYSEDFED